MILLLLLNRRRRKNSHPLILTTKNLRLMQKNVLLWLISMIFRKKNYLVGVISKSLTTSTDMIWMSHNYHFFFHKFSPTNSTARYMIRYTATEKKKKESWDISEAESLKTLSLSRCLSFKSGLSLLGAWTSVVETIISAGGVCIYCSWTMCKNGY